MCSWQIISKAVNCGLKGITWSSPAFNVDDQLHVFQSVVHLKREASHRPIHRYACTQTSLQLPRIRAKKKDILLNPETKRSANGRQNESVICDMLEGAQREDPKRGFTRIYTSVASSLCYDRTWPFDSSTTFCDSFWTRLTHNNIGPTVAISSSAAPESAWHKCPIRTAEQLEKQVCFEISSKRLQRRISRGGLMLAVAGGDGSFCQCWDDDCWCCWVAASLSLFVLLVILPCVSLQHVYKPMWTNCYQRDFYYSWGWLAGTVGIDTAEAVLQACCSCITIYHHNSWDQTARSTKDLLDKLVQFAKFIRSC